MIDQACEIYISNQYYEILELSRIDLLGNKENIFLHSSEGGTFFVSKFLFNFLSSLANPEADSILTPIPSTHLAPICQMLNLRNDVQGDIMQFAEELKILGLDFNSCQNLVSSLNESSVKPTKIDPDNLGNDNEKNGKKIDEPGKETKKNKTQLNPPEDVQVENHSTNFSASEEILKEEFPLAAFEENGQNFEDADNDRDSNNENVENANALRTQVMIETVTKKILEMQMQSPKTITKLVKGRQEFASLECRMCGKIFQRKEYTSKGQLAFLKLYHKHLHKHKSSSLECECDIEFKSTQEKMNHMKLIHDKFLKCDQCEYTPNDKQSLEEHKATKHTLKLCHICDFSTNSCSSALKYHVERMHQVQVDENKPNIELKCNIKGFKGCEKIFYRPGDLNHHHKTYHMYKECPICHKMFKKKRLQQHIDNIHDKKKKVCCEKCGKGFSSQSLLDQHEAVVHQGVRYQCRYPDCQFKDQQYRDKSNRVAHERNKHGSPYIKTWKGRKLN